MATTGTFTYSPPQYTVIDEAYERIGIKVKEITGEHIESAQRSLPLLLVEWATRGIKQFKIDQQTRAMTVGLTTFTLPSGTLDVLDMSILRSGSYIPLHPMSRQEYLLIADKDNPGLSNAYFIDKQRDSVTCTLWPIGENTTDTIVYNRLKMAEDIGDMTYSIDVPYIFLEALHAGLAARLAEKWAVGRLEEKIALAARMFSLAFDEHSERADIDLGMTYNYGY